MTTDVNVPFERDEYLDVPGIVGARWWNRELKDDERKASRRQALVWLGVGVGTVAVGGVIAAIAEATDVDFQRFPLQMMQRRFGWNFGARSQAVTFDGRRVLPFDPSRLATLASDCVGNAYSSLQSAAIFDAILHTPAETPSEETLAFQRLVDWLVPVLTTTMGHAYRVGQSLGRLLARTSRRVAVIADLGGPESVAFAAGLAETHAPVFLLDHWPHPRGVVPAHMTLASATFFQPRFVETKSRRPADAPPVFVLDRNRSAPYADAMDRFDNRYVPRMPSGAALESVASVRDVLYFGQGSASAYLDLDDVNPALVAYRTMGFTVRGLSPEAFFSSTFEPDADNEGPIESVLHQNPLYYGGTLAREADFSEHYAWGTVPSAEPPPMLPDARSWAWAPIPRPTMLPPAALALIGTVDVALNGQTVLGARYDRNGSWNRVSSSGSSWGG